MLTQSHSQSSKSNNTTTIKRLSAIAYADCSSLSSLVLMLALSLQLSLSVSLFLQTYCSQRGVFMRVFRFVRMNEDDFKSPDKMIELMGFQCLMRRYTFSVP